MAELTSIVQEMGRESLDFLNKVINDAEPVVVAFSSPHLIPTAIRYFEERCFKKSLLVVGGIVGASFSILPYALSFNSDKPEYLAIPLITNATSLIYEWGRKVNEKIESKRIYH